MVELLPHSSGWTDCKAIAAGVWEEQSQSRKYAIIWLTACPGHACCMLLPKSASREPNLLSQERSQAQAFLVLSCTILSHVSTLVFSCTRPGSVPDSVGKADSAGPYTKSHQLIKDARKRWRRMAQVQET